MMYNIRPAVLSDLKIVKEIVHESYRKYVERIGKPPGPMLDDYQKIINEKLVYVLEIEGEVQAVLVLEPRDSYMLLDNIAVHPSSQSRGFGKILMKFAEDTAVDLGYDEIQLYTHETMVENIGIYTHLGWKEFKRQNDDGYRRIYMKKSLRKHEKIKSIQQ
jgi:ribosomal protein S18 acetylase RimI-like enzyme